MIPAAPAVQALRSSALALEVDLAVGAKITSLRNVFTGREWLLQPASQTSSRYRPRYGDTFTDAPLGGWDEMFPTVDACRYLDEHADAERGAIELPDHGEVWSQQWRLLSHTETSLSCAIEGKALDYQLRRTIELSGRTARFHYSLGTRREGGLAALWAPHPQFAVQPGTLLRLPPIVTRLGLVDEGASGPMRELPLPDHTLDWRDVAASGSGAMLYADPDVRLGTARLVDPDGSWLQLSWDSEQIPYFALWVDNGLFGRSPVVCPEPMTGYYDSLRAAQARRRVLRLPQDSTIEWTLTVEVGAAAEATAEPGGEET